MHALYEWLSQSDGWFTIALVLVVTLTCIGFLRARLAALQRDTASGREKLLDGLVGWIVVERLLFLVDRVFLDPAAPAHFLYSAADVTSLFDGLGARGRRLYAWTASTLDVLFAFAYGLLLGLLLVRLWPPNQAWLLLLPLITVIAALLENVTIALMISSYREGEVPPLAGPAAVFTSIKWIFFLLSLLAILIGFLHALPRLGCC